jgi:hypothetical protein
MRVFECKVLKTEMKGGGKQEGVGENFVMRSLEICSLSRALYDKEIRKGDRNYLGMLHEENE